jgi:DegV family protein with EDD domain
LKEDKRAVVPFSKRKKDLKIVTDSGTDLYLSREEIAEQDIHVVPLVVSIDGREYHEGVDIEPEAFYDLLEKSASPAKTSQPSVGDFAGVYKSLASVDPEILSIHMSSGLSGTLNAAKEAAKLVPEAHVTHIDTRTLAVAAGWQVLAAARAAKAGWVKERIIALTERISAASESLYTVKELKYLIQGGRISHLKGLLAVILGIKPLIGVEKVNGTYVQRGQAHTFRRAIEGIVDLLLKEHKPQSNLRVQVCHSNNPEGAAILRDLIDKRFKCTWLPVGRLSLVLGAHTGPSMVAAAYAPSSVFADIP